MIGISFLYTFATVALILSLMTLISYAAPDSLIGRTLAIIK